MVTNAEQEVFMKIKRHNQTQKKNARRKIKEYKQKIKRLNQNQKWNARRTIKKYMQELPNPISVKEVERLLPPTSSVRFRLKKSNGATFTPQWRFRVGINSSRAKERSFGVLNSGTANAVVLGLHWSWQYQNKLQRSEQSIEDSTGN